MLFHVVDIPHNLHKHARNLVITRATAAPRSIWFWCNVVIRLARSNDKYTTNRTGNSSIIQGNRVTYRIVARVSLSLSLFLFQPTALPLNTPIGQVSLARPASLEQVLFRRRTKKVAGREQKVATRRRGHSRPFQRLPLFFFDLPSRERNC